MNEFKYSIAGDMGVSPKNPGWSAIIQTGKSAGFLANFKKILLYLKSNEDYVKHMDKWKDNFIVYILV